MAAKKIHLWQRDQDIIRETARSPMLTSQIARLHGFPSRKKAAERNQLLYLAGLLKRVPYFSVKQGKPEFVYFIKGAPQARTLAHTIGVAEVRVQVAEWLRNMQGYAGDFYYGTEVQTTSGLIPDATLLLRRAEKTGLFFFEVDNGTEVVSSPSGYSLAKKLAAYASYFDASGYVRDFAWAGTLRGFRVALIVPAGRARNLQQFVAEQGHDFALITTFASLAQGLHRPVWFSHDGSRVDFLGRPGGHDG